MAVLELLGGRRRTRRLLAVAAGVLLSLAGAGAVAAEDNIPALPLPGGSGTPWACVSVDRYYACVVDPIPDPMPNPTKDVIEL